MKHFIALILTVTGIGASAQSIVGTWQLTDQKTCFQSQFEELTETTLRFHDVKRDCEIKTFTRVK